MKHPRTPMVLAYLLLNVVQAGAAPVKPAAESLGAEARTATFLVGSQRGLERWSTDGQTTMVSRGPAHFPRWRSADKVLVLTDTEVTSGQAQVIEVSLATGKRRTLAKLATFACNGANDPQPLALQSPDDFRVDRALHKACLTLMDRNINMASLSLDVEIDLTTGRSKRWLSLGEDQCQPPPDVVVSPTATSQCAPTNEEVRQAPNANYRFAFDPRGRIVERSSKVVKRLAALKGFSAGPLSPSGRWLLIESETEDGDYIHRGILLFDRSDGSVHRVPREATQVWAPPVDLSKNEAKAPVLDVVGEDDVRWLPVPGTDVLVVNDLVVVPGVRVFIVRGELAR